MIYFIWLIVTAVLLYYAKWPILLIAGIVGWVKLWGWLTQRFPTTMYVINRMVHSFIDGMFGR